MHQGDSPTPVSGRELTQAQADNCCASSEREQSNTSKLTLVATHSPTRFSGLASSCLPALLLSTSATTGERPSHPEAAVPRHVLLSVFLV